MDGALKEIEGIQMRLGEIANERDRLPDDADRRRQELLDEEHRLEARLIELEDEVATSDRGAAEEEAAAQTDLTRSPKLPTDAED
jgi:hypothetical protein